MTKDLALGIDIGGTNTAFGIVNRRGDLMHKGSIPTLGHRDIHAYIDALKKAILPLLSAYEYTQLAGLGIGAPNGNYYTGQIMHAPNLPWKGMIPLAELMEDAFNLKAVLTNDANAAAIGELQYGVAKGMKDFILVTLGTGVGSGFVANGQLIYGTDGFAGEMGHVIAVRYGRPCGCGRNGCLETYASATGIVRTAQEWLSMYPHSPLQQTPTITAKSIYEAALEGDELALKVFDYTGQILGQCLADMVAITSPEAIIVFGGLAQSGDMLLQPTRLYMEENLLYLFKNKVQILASQFPGADAAILGASALAW